MAENNTRRKRNPRFVTPKGIAIYPYLITPDVEYNADGEYKVKLRLKPEGNVTTANGKPLGTVEDFLQEKAEEALEQMKADNPKVKNMKQADLPYEVDDETGDVLVNFKLRAVGKTRDGEVFTQSPMLFDKKGKPFDGEQIWGGSTLKVSFEVIPFYTKLIGAGITLRLKAAQVVELVAGGAAGAGDYGFGSEAGDDEYEDGDEFEGQEADDYDDTPATSTDNAHGDF